MASRMVELSEISMNFSLEVLMDSFYDFTKDSGEFGAMAYNTDSKEIVHIGNTPERELINDN